MDWIVCMDYSYSHRFCFLSSADTKAKAALESLEEYVRMLSEAKLPGGFDPESILNESFAFSIRPCLREQGRALCINPPECDDAEVIYPNRERPENPFFLIVRKVAKRYAPARHG